MPTGYTADVGNGQSFEDFVLGCARAFGACIMQRDDPMSVKPTLQEPSRHHTEKLLIAKQNQLEFLAMTEEEKIDYGNQCKEEDIFRINERIEKNIALADKYTSMFMKVLDWVPPSSEHVELKQFMLKQLQESKDFDCNNDYNYRELEKTKSMTPIEFYDNMMESIAWNIKYHSEESIEEIERVNGRNTWIEKLYESLK